MDVKAHVLLSLKCSIVLFQIKVMSKTKFWDAKLDLQHDNGLFHTSIRTRKAIAFWGWKKLCHIFCTHLTQHLQAAIFLV